MAQPNKPHWGNWLKQRARFVGFRGVSMLARECGCSRQTIQEWFASVAPSNMRKGHDVRICESLKVDRELLFSGYGQVAPEESPLLEPHRIAPAPTDENHLRRKVLAIVELLGTDQLREVHDHGRKLLAATAA